MRNFVNKNHIEGFVYEHNLELKVTGPNSKAPGTEYITGTLNIATDNAITNIVPVHFSYVTATTAKNTDNATFKILRDILDAKVKTVMTDGAESAAKVRIDTAFGLNEFYVDRDGKEEFVSTRRNEGGFIHFTDTLAEKEDERSTFECDMLITNVRRIEADEEKGTREKAIVKGAIFDYRKALLPTEFTVYHPGAIDYFEGLAPTAKEPVVTRVRGVQISETVVKKIEEPSAFGDPIIREVKSSRKDCVITWAATDTYEFDSEDSLTVSELNEAIAAREINLATIKQKRDEYKAAKAKANTAPSAFDTPTSKKAFDF